MSGQRRELHLAASTEVEVKRKRDIATVTVALGLGSKKLSHHSKAGEVSCGSKAGAIAVRCGNLQRVGLVLRAQCHCRACQHISGGPPNLFMLMPAEGFAYTKGAPKTCTRPDNSGILRGVRYAHDHAAARPTTGGSEDRNAGRSFNLWRRANGNLYGGRSAFPSHCGRRGRL